MTWGLAFFLMSMRSLAFFSPMLKHHLATFTFSSLDQGAGGRSIRGQLWSQSWMEHWLSRLTLLWDSGHVTESPSYHLEKGDNNSYL